tara:strand:+ start:804 stop:1868 length:1065 start_codon:yes stop_codon:yes gene_type:complete
MEKKNLTIFFNCHGNYIFFYLKKFLPIDFNINWIYIADFEGGGGNRKYFNEKEINILKDTDILIVQYIKNDRNFLNHDKVIKLVKQQATVIKIPHYTFYGYNFKELSNNILSIVDKELDFKKIKEYIDLKFDENINKKKEEFQKYKLKSLKNIRKKDEYSDVKLYDSFKKHYNTKVLFNEPWHPNSFFIYLMVIEILKKLNFDFDKKYIQVYEIFNESQFNLDKEHIELMYKIQNFEVDNFHKNISNVYENYLYNGYNSILYNPVNIQDLDNINEIEILKCPFDNIVKLTTDNHIYYTSIFKKEKINIKNYLYFHSNLLLKLEETNQNNLQTLKDHPSCTLLNKDNYLRINDDL